MLSGVDNITAFDQLIAGIDIPGDAGVALDTSGTPTFGGRGILRFASVGDVDGDGKDDIAAGSLWAKARDDVSIGNFTVFSGLDTADASFTVRPEAVFQAAATDLLLEGFNFSSLGDFDGDGRQEILVGRDPRVGGRTDAGAHTLHEIGDGISVGHRIASSGGSETNFIGDINGDGFDDIFRTAPDGISHGILLGNPAGEIPVEIALAGSGEIAVHQFGYAVSGGADLNDDGIDDFAVLDRGENSLSVFFGSADIATGPTLTIDTPADGFRLRLPATPQSVELLQDFNGDGIGDLLVSWRGGAEIVFGTESLSGTRTLASLAEAEGLSIDLAGPNSLALGVGDLNGDGLSDINFSTRNAEGGSDVGVIFGSADLSGTIGLSDLDGSNGFVVTGATAGQSAGDTNGDGIGDLMLRVGSGGASFMAIIHGRAASETVPAVEEEPAPPPVEPIVIPAPSPAPPPSDDPVGEPGPPPPPAPGPPPGHPPAPPPDQPATPDEVLPGSEAPDIIHGSPETDSVDALGGDDRVFGAAGDDTLNGGDGDDHLVGGPGSDLLTGDAGNDRILGEGHDDALFGGLGDDAIRGHGGDDLLDGGAGNDSLNGGDGQDELHGDDGNDLLKGGADDDRLFGGLGDDALLGGDGDDQAFGGVGRDVLKGGEGNDTLDGGAGNDRISGGIGDDELIGGGGHDFLTGGGGADRFVLELSGGQDEILDFDASEGDRLDFSRLGIQLESVAINELSGNLVIDVADIRVILTGLNRGSIELDDVSIF